MTVAAAFVTRPRPSAVGGAAALAKAALADAQRFNLEAVHTAIEVRAVVAAHGSRAHIIQHLHCAPFLLLSFFLLFFLSHSVPFISPLPPQTSNGRPFCCLPGAVAGWVHRHMCARPRDIEPRAAKARRRQHSHEQDRAANGE